MRRFVICLLAVLFLLPAPLWAAKALEGTYASEQLGLLKIVIKNDDTYRIDIIEDDEEPISMMVIGGKRWVVGRDDPDTPWEVLDYDAVLTHFADEMTTLPDMSKDADIAKPTTQTVGKFKGQAFKVDYPDEGDFMLVLSDDKDVAKVSKLILALMKEIGEDEIVMAAYVMERLAGEQQKDFGLLVCEDDYELKNLEYKDYPDSYFMLPENKKIMTVEEMFTEQE